MFFAALFSVFSCAEEELPNPDYDGGSYLSFAKTSDVTGVLVGTNHFDYIINYETIAPVAANTEVKLVLDAANSTAVEGVDFQIVNPTDNLASGKSTGKFTVRILESGMSTTAKVAKFKLQSATIPYATFRQDFTLSMTLICPDSDFPGLFTVKNTLFGTYDVEIAAGTTPGTLILKEIGRAHV